MLSSWFWSGVGLKVGSGLSHEVDIALPCYLCAVRADEVREDTTQAMVIHQGAKDKRCYQCAMLQVCALTTRPKL